MRRRNSGTMACVIGVVAVALAVSGCSSNGTAKSNSGSTSASESTGVAEAKSAVDAASGDLPYVQVGTPQNVAKLRGKKVWIIEPTLTIPLVKYLTDNVSKVLSTYGVTLTVVDGKGDVSEYNRSIETAITAKADLILLSVDSSTVAGSVEDAKKAGIPVVTILSGYPGEPIKTDGVTADVSWDYRIPGKLLADWFVSDSGGKGDAVVLTSNEVPSSVILQDSFKAEMARVCPSTCTYSFQDTAISQWQSRIPTLTQTAIQKDPKLGYILPVFDGMATSVLPSVDQAGADSRIKVASFNGTPAVMQFLQDKSSPMVMDISNPNSWLNYAVIDTVFRVLNGNDASLDYKIPFRVFTKNNVTGLNLTSEDDKAWFGFDYLPDFQKLWLVQ